MPDGSFGVSVVPSTDPRRMTGPMTLAGLLLLAGLITRVTGLDHAGVSFCYFKALTGYACFTCGTTRALGHLARFDLPGAFSIQPLITVSVLALLSWGAFDAALLPFARRTVVRLGERNTRRLALIGAILASLNWAYLLATGV